jgi:hypothetical protein
MIHAAKLINFVPVAAIETHPRDTSFSPSARSQRV